MHSSKKGNQSYFGMKAHFGVDADLGLVHTVRGTAGHVHDINEGNAFLHGQEQMIFADAGYRGIEKRSDATHLVRWHVAMRPGQGKALDKSNAADALVDAAEKLKAGVRAKVEHPFRVIKRQFGHIKVRYWGLKKKHTTADDAVCAVELVDGARPTDASAGISASANRADAL